MESTNEGEAVLANVLFMDIIGCSSLASDEQKKIVGRLQELVRESNQFKRSLKTEQVISLPTGDGMALVFFDKLDAAVLCAMEVTKSIKAEALCKIRMGVHSGPVFVMEDINGGRNVSGAGINLAERVMSCGAEGHILLSDSIAASLRHLSAWRDKIHEIGECQVKDGWIRVWNLIDGQIGNAAIPRKSKRYIRKRSTAATGASDQSGQIKVGMKILKGPEQILDSIVHSLSSAHLANAVVYRVFPTELTYSVIEGHQALCDKYEALIRQMIMQASNETGYWDKTIYGRALSKQANDKTVEFIKSAYLPCPDTSYLGVEDTYEHIEPAPSAETNS